MTPGVQDRRAAEHAGTSAGLAAARSPGQEPEREAPQRARREAPQRRCIATGVSGPRDMLLRFVADPEGRLVPDLAGKLPGRGAWVAADRKALERAVKRRLFTRSLGRPVSVSETLVTDLERALERRILELIGLCSRAGLAICGYEKARAVLKAGGAAALVQAADASPDGRGKLARLGLAVDPALPVLALSGAEALGRALGRDQAVHLVLLPGRLSEMVLHEAARLAGVAGTELVSKIERDTSRPELDVRNDDDE